MRLTQQHTAVDVTTLFVSDIEAAHADMVGRGVEVSDIWHIEPGTGRVPGVDPQRRSYLSRASFAGPDGTAGILEEITQRFPGRREIRDAGALARLLFETAKRHGAFDSFAAPHDWWDWYGAYMDARAQGAIAEEAAKVAGRYMEVEHVVVASA